MYFLLFLALNLFKAIFIVARHCIKCRLLYPICLRHLIKQRAYHIHFSLRLQYPPDLIQNCRHFFHVHGDCGHTCGDFSDLVGDSARLGCDGALIELGVLGYLFADSASSGYNHLFLPVRELLVDAEAFHVGGPFLLDHYRHVPVEY